MKNKILNIGIIGYGRMGIIRHKEIKKNKYGNVISIYDPKSRHNNIFTKNYDDIIKNDNIDIVFICTPNYLNAELSMKALKNNKHVFCEKPPSLNANELKKIITLEKKFNKKIMYGFNHRHYDSIKLMKEKINSKEFGKILWLRGRYGKSVDSNFFNNWRSNKKLSGGGIFIDQGIHMLDLMLFFCSDFDKVQSFKSNSYWQKEVEDNVFVNLKNTKKNIICSLHSTMTQWRHLFSLEIFLEKGYMTLNGLKTSTNSYGKEELEYAINRSYPPSAKWSKSKKHIFTNNNSWKNEMDVFFNSIKNNTKILSCGTQDALKVMRIVDKVYN